MQSQNDVGHMVMVLDAAYQSWGENSRFMERTTGSIPSKSALIGMMCAAMGIDRSMVEIQYSLATNKFDIVGIANRARLYRDYHTIGGGYDPKKNPGDVIMTANGKISGEAAITHRYYLCDAKFVAIVTGNVEVLKIIGSALKHPVWGPWAGRKCCPFSDVIFRGVFETYDDAMKYVEGYFSSELKDGEKLFIKKDIRCKFRQVKWGTF